MCEVTGPTHCSLATITRIFACLTRCAVSAQEVLNTVWYRFALCTAKRVGRWPNYTTGELYDLPGGTWGDRPLFPDDKNIVILGKQSFVPNLMAK